MLIYTVSFFGHRVIEDYRSVEGRLRAIVSELIRTKEYVEFLVGRDGDFDILAASVIRQARKDYGSSNSSLILMLPYMRADYKKNERLYLEYYDEVEICEASSEAYFKAAIQIRNRSMIDRSDLVVCCIDHNSGGAYKSMRYAESKGRGIINIAEDNAEI